RAGGAAAAGQSVRQPWAVSTSVPFPLGPQRLASCASSPELSQNPILDPVCIPPLDRVHHLSVHEHREVEVIAAGHSGHAAAADLLFLVHRLASLDVDRGEVAIE